jgi:hypothetical protein
MFGLSPEELAVAAAAWASLGAGIVGVFIRCGRILQRLEDHERRIENLEGLRRPVRVVER